MSELQIGYCANVHPGRTLAEVKSNLTKFTLAVKKEFRPDQAMGVGLWLSQTATSELADRDSQSRFSDWLHERGLVPFTFNGFPYGDFHQAIVKHDVYLPTWADPARLEFTIRLAEIQACLLDHGNESRGTISTLPLGWPTEEFESDRSQFLDECAHQIRDCAHELNQIKQSTGHDCLICIEPEPGCILDTCEDIVRFFDEHLFNADDASNEITRHHIGICHDVCHSAVMFEKQSTAFAAYRNAGIQVGKIQVSSAVEVDFETLSESQRTAALDQLTSFAEPRYLHQTSIRIDNQLTFHEDLGIALKTFGTSPTGKWRVHFHVPIFAERFGLIGTTQGDILRCLSAALPAMASGNEFGSTQHLEVETYAWNVLPTGLAESNLARGIATELKWLEKALEVQPDRRD